MADHVARNRAAWDDLAARYAEEGRRNWAGEPVWGIWRVPEADVGVFADGFVTVEWARRWPTEEVWHVRRSGSAG